MSIKTRALDLQLREILIRKNTSQDGQRKIYSRIFQTFSLISMIISGYDYLQNYYNHLPTLQNINCRHVEGQGPTDACSQ
jgi:hypothetical protein